MKRTSLSSLCFNWLCILVLCIALPSVSLAQSSDQEFLEESVAGESMQQGIVAVLEVTGQVELIDAENKSLGQASKGDKIGNGISIATGPGARADLAFSNGLMMQIQENSRFTIADFEHEPYEFVFTNGVALNARDLDKFGDEKAVLTNLDASEDAWNDMEIEPVTAASEFVLHYGTMIGETKKLQPGSRLDIVTPIGTAGIRGTIWRLTVIPAGNGFYRGTLDVSRGRVTFTNADGRRTINVAAGFNMNIEARTAQNGEVNVTAVTTNRMTQERVELLNSSVQNVKAVQTFFAAVQGTPEILTRVENITGKTGTNADGNNTGNNNTGDTNNTNDGDTTQQPNPNPPGTIADPTQGSTGGTDDKPRPTPRPTATPKPTATPRPTPTATPIPTPTPTATPTPRPSN